MRHHDITVNRTFANVRDIIGYSRAQVESFYHQGAVSQDLFEAWMCLWAGGTFRYSHSPCYCPQCDSTH